MVKENPHRSKAQKERDRQRHAEIERRFKEWAQSRIESERYISARYASFLVDEYCKQTGISSMEAISRLREWGLNKLITPPPHSPEVFNAPPEIREHLLELWERRDGILGWS